MAQGTEQGDGGTVMLGGPAHMTRIYVDPKSRNYIQWASDNEDKPHTLYRFERIAFGREGYVEVLVHESLTLDEALPFVHRWIIETMGGTLRPRCRHVSPSPWGATQCVLPLDHDERDERHAYSPSEAIEDAAEVSR